MFVWRQSYYVAVLVRVPVTMMKLHDQKQLGRKGFIWLTLLHHSSSSKEIRAGIHTGLKPGAGAGTEASVSWLAPRGFLSLLSYRIQDHQPRDCTTCNELGLPLRSCQSLNNKLPYSLLLWGNSLNWGSPVQMNLVCINWPKVAQASLPASASQVLEL